MINNLCSKTMTNRICKIQFHQSSTFQINKLGVWSLENHGCHKTNCTMKELTQVLVTRLPTQFVSISTSQKVSCPQQFTPCTTSQRFCCLPPSIRRECFNSKEIASQDLFQLVYSFDKHHGQKLYQERRVCLAYVI